MIFFNNFYLRLVPRMWNSERQRANRTIRMTAVCRIVPKMYNSENSAKRGYADINPDILNLKSHPSSSGLPWTTYTMETGTNIEMGETVERFWPLCCSKAVTRPTVSVSPEFLLEMENIRPQLRQQKWNGFQVFPMYTEVWESLL